MKRVERTLTEIALDEIFFDLGDGQAFYKLYTRKEFDKLCETLSIMPILQEPILFLKGVARDKNLSMGWYMNWEQSFFRPTNIVKFRSIYEVARAIKEASASLT